jgi:hypothetical protein
MKYNLLLLAIILLVSVFYLGSGLFSKHITYTSLQPTITSAPITVLPTEILKLENKLIYINNVPFAAQAPFGNWKDPLEQNGCEEAAATIAVYWAQNKTLSGQQMLNEITAISAYEQKNYGNAVDTSADDTVNRIITGYYHYYNAKSEKISNPEQIINWLSENYLVITPMNGQKILNHNYTAPGPQRHMIVIRGYDPKTEEFITNDAGTRLGKDFRYPKALFFASIRDYPTGDHMPFSDVSTKSAILVW